MTELAFSLDDISLTLGAFSLRHIGFSLEPGEVLVILGPNGAGKSVLLETIAGFHAPERGRIRIQGRDVTGLPPERRHVGFIFQNFSLFPHLTVAENIAFGLDARKTRAQSARDGERETLIGRFGLGGLEHRHPVDLSPGEKQRVALARSLAVHPDLFLLDEPFSALDSRTSGSLREELRLFLREMRIPAVFVSHDHLDAMILADKIALMQKGEIVQIGAPAEVFARPSSRFAAEFLGVENILSAVPHAQTAEDLEVGIGGRILHARTLDQALTGDRGLCACIRAEDVRISPSIDDAAAASSHSRNRLSGTVQSMSGLGPLTRVVLDCGFPLIAYALNRSVGELGLRAGVEVVAEIDPEAVHLIPEP